MENAGVPSLAIISEPFGFKARMEVTAMGMAKLPIQVLPHPIGQLSDEMMRQIADEAWDEILFAITADADKVATRYSEATGLESEYTYKGAV
jgi:hypothetical protein